ncbi:MAG TPA: hypothetical protein VFK97_02120 [Candidatus Saccharimonadales bacterium]|nr:hypothetical protein [Candidatus Saccharimonadales bacterium]
MLRLGVQKFSGDTMIEVLLAIGVAVFAIGITYATAERALNQTITAREHGQALSIMENQITDLRLRFAKSANFTLFNQYFGGSNNHFCLDDSATVPSTTQPWTPYFNDGPNGPPSEQGSLTSKAIQGPYDPKCISQKPGDGAVFYIDIQTATLPHMAQNPTVYRVFVRWDRVGGGRAQTSLYYRPDGAASQTLGYALPVSLDKLYAYRGTTDES